MMPLLFLLFATVIDPSDGDIPIRDFTFEAACASLSAPAMTLPVNPYFPLHDDFFFTGDAPEGDNPSAAAFSTDGTKIIIAHRDSRNLVVFDAATRVFLNAIALSGSPNDVAVSLDGIHAVTANVFEDTASVVDLVTGAEIAVVPIGDQPGVAAITPDGLTAVVGNTKDSTLSVIDILTATELRRLSDAVFVGSFSFAPEPGAYTASFSRFVVPDNGTVVHPDFYNDRIQIFDITTGGTTTLACDDQPRGVTSTPDGSTVVVAHTSSVRKISVIDVAGKTISKTVATPDDLWGAVAVSSDGSKAVVAVQNACRVVNLSSGGASASLNTASVYDLRTTADGLYVLCIGYNGSLIELASETIKTHLNKFVSTPVGAVSPVDPRGVLVANTFGEDMVVVNTSGASGHMEGTAKSGPPPEGDKARTAAVSPDGLKAVSVNLFSDNATIVDLVTGTVEAIVDVGDRPAEVEITPDSSKAVVANLDSTFASVIDLTTYSVTNIPITRRASQVEISPDGKYAYLAVVADGDGVWRINLLTLSVEGPRLFTTNMGSVGFLFWQTSGMTLSNDGAVLAVCGSFDDSLSLIDTASWSVVATVPVGDFPVRALFAHDDAQIFVSTRDDDKVRMVSNAGPSSSVLRTYNVGDSPFELALSPDGDTLYVMNYGSKNIGIVDVPGGMMTSTVGLPNSPAGMALGQAGRYLYVATGNWSLTMGPGAAFSYSQTGEFSVIDTWKNAVNFQINTGLPPAMLKLNAAAALAVVPSPMGDGITAVWHKLLFRKL